MPLVTASHNNGQPAKPIQIQRIAQDACHSGSPSSSNQCVGSLTPSTNSLVDCLSLNFASNASLDSPMQKTLVSKLDFDCEFEGTLVKSPLFLDEIGQGNDVENVCDGNTSLQKTSASRLCLSESKKSKRSETTMTSRSRSCLSEMTNVMANRLNTCPLQVKTDYPTDFHSKHNPMSPSPVAAGAENACVTNNSGNYFDSLKDSSSKCSKRALSFQDSSTSKSARKISCPVAPSSTFTCSKTREDPLTESFDEDELLFNDFNNFASFRASPAISVLVNGDILNLPTRKADEGRDSPIIDVPSDASCTSLIQPRKKHSEPSCENESRKRFSPRSASVLSSPNAKRKKVTKSPEKAPIEFIAKLSPMMIGDGTREHILPLVRGKRPNHATISGETLVRLLKGEFNRFLQSWFIVDCRYPYEYEGGHIKEALNIWTKEMCREKFFSASKPFGPKSSCERKILIFHCEFSSERAPKMYDFVRETDRRLNGQHYPLLDYPEIYVLHAGYREFFKRFSNFCYPQNYIEMYDKKYKEDMKKCRIKSKTEENQTESKTKNRLLVNRSNTCML